MKPPTKHVQSNNRGLAIFIKTFASRSSINKNKIPFTVRIIHHIVPIINNYLTIINDTTAKVAFALWSKCLTEGPKVVSILT